MEEANAVQKKDRDQRQRTWIFHSTPGQIFCVQMKPKWTCLEGTHNALCVGGLKNVTGHQHQNLIHTVNSGGRVAVMD